MTALSLKRVKQEEAALLLGFAEPVFRHAFEHLNEAEHFEIYMREAFTLKQFEAELANSESVFYFALLENEIVGYIKLNWASAQTDLQQEPGIELQRIYVKPELQGKKIGQYLLSEAIEFSQERNFPFIWLGVWEKNPAAIRFYERHGFSQFSSHTFMVGNDPQTDFLLKLDFISTEKN